MKFFVLILSILGAISSSAAQAGPKVTDKVSKIN
jgi:hypothetical protein